MVSATVSEWTPNQTRFIRWLAMPETERTQRTHAEFAGSIGVTERTVFRWKELPGLTRAAAELAQTMVDDDLPEIYAALKTKAKAGSFPHIKLALEVAGHLQSSSGAGVNVNVSVDARRTEDREQRFERLFSELGAYRAHADGDDGSGDTGVSMDSGSTEHPPAAVPRPPA